MKRGGPLKRKTEMNRGKGFTRPTKDSRNPNEPAWGEKPRKPLNRVSKKNSKKHLNRGFRREYMRENPKCELCKVADSTDPHHICRRILGTLRWDIRANLLATCRACHEWWGHGNRLREGLVLCLTEKRLKNELDWDELNRITHMNLREHIRGYEIELDWIKPYWQALIGGGE